MQSIAYIGGYGMIGVIVIRPTFEKKKLIKNTLSLWVGNCPMVSQLLKHATTSNENHWRRLHVSTFDKLIFYQL